MYEFPDHVSRHHPSDAPSQRFHSSTIRSTTPTEGKRDADVSLFLFILFFFFFLVFLFLSFSPNHCRKLHWFAPRHMIWSEYFEGKKELGGEGDREGEGRSGMMMNGTIMFLFLKMAKYDRVYSDANF